MKQENPYASPATSPDVQPAAPVASQVLRTAGLTICFLLASISTLIGLFGVYVLISEALAESGAIDVLLFVLFYLGFGVSWFLAGAMFLTRRRAWGWIAIAVGVAIPVTLTGIFGL